jgi:threonine dehydrogenase-like Zn-dependent dehydrogenase
VLGIGGEMAESYKPAMELLARNLDRLPLDGFVSHRLPLEDAQRGLELAQREEAMKVVLSPAAA